LYEARELAEEKKTRTQFSFIITVQIYPTLTDGLGSIDNSHAIGRSKSVSGVEFTFDLGGGERN
jgi:hypothetical protein